MATLECDHETVAGVTLVECRLTSDVPQRVTVETTHDAPIWPPRRQGVPEAGWCDDGWTGIVHADGVRALGYATPAEPTDRPVRIATTEPPADDEPVSARDVIRSLGDPSPARDAVPVPEEVTRGERTTDRSAGLSPDSNADPPTDSKADPTADSSADGPLRGLEDEDAVGVEDAIGDENADSQMATGVDLDAIETRLWTAQDLAAVSTVEEAHAAVDRAGGMSAVRSLAAQLETDRERLDDLQKRTARLAEESTAVDVPLSSLERLV